MSEYLRKHRPDRYEKLVYIQQYKLDRGCSICGYNEVAHSLDLDHIDRSKKRGKLSDAHLWSWKAIHEELENCVVLCANCHRKKTAEEKDYFVVGREEEDDPQLDLL